MTVESNKPTASVDDVCVSNTSNTPISTYSFAVFNWIEFLVDIASRILTAWIETFTVWVSETRHLPLHMFTVSHRSTLHSSRQ